jgi:hypothetical protein
MNRLAASEVIAELAGGLLLAGLKQEVSRVGQMIGHETRGEFGVALLNRVKDRLMELQSVFQINQLRGHHDHIEHGAVDGLKETTRKTIA